MMDWHGLFLHNGSSLSNWYGSYRLFKEWIMLLALLFFPVHLESVFYFALKFVNIHKFSN